MTIKTRMTAVVTAAMLILALPGVADAGTRADDHRRKSTTEKVLTAAAVGAVAGIALYALTRDDNRHHRGHYQDRYGYRYGNRHGYGRYNQHRSYFALNVGFEHYCVGSPYHQRCYRGPQGYWYSNGPHRFHRKPYQYNHRYSRAFNAGWERGYWAGYLQGRQDAYHRARYYDRFHWNNGQLWGYQSHVGSYGQYQQAFHAAFSTGYQHGFRGREYGCESFGYGHSYGGGYGRDYDYGHSDRYPYRR